MLVNNELEKDLDGSPRLGIALKTVRCLSGWPVCGQRLELGASIMRSRNANHPTMMFKSTNLNSITNYCKTLNPFPEHVPYASSHILPAVHSY